MYRVMLVEDNNEIQQNYVKMKEWQECGFAIEEKATNGSQAFNILKNHELDVIFTEIKLPLMDGITLIKQVKQEYQIYCLYLSVLAMNLNMLERGFA